MAELTIRPEEIRDALDNFVQNYEPETAVREEVGTVVTSGDGIAHVEGLPRPWPTSCCASRMGRWALPLTWRSGKSVWSCSAIPTVLMRIDCSWHW